MKRHLAYLPVFLLALVPLFTGSTCSRDLDPLGPYAGDRLLWELDGVIDETTQAFDAVIAWAERNPEYLAENASVAAKVAAIRAELDGVPAPDETLTRLHRVRDAYRAAKTAANTEAVRSEIVAARTALSTARNILTLFANPAPETP